MSFNLDLSAVRAAAENTTTHHWLMANAANVANLANENQPDNPKSPEKLATLAGLATLAISHGLATGKKPAPDWTPPAPPPDPGPAHLLALAMALCDRTGATEQECADWRADIEQAAPEHRGHLLALVHSLMPKPPPIAMEIVEIDAPAPKPLPLFHVAQPWNVADKAYQAHHWSCTTCKAAARSGGSSQRCTVGQHLHQLYEQAFEAAKEST